MIQINLIMKKNMYKIGVFFMLIALTFSCDDNDINYTPKEYAQPSNLTIGTTNIVDTSFEVNFTADQDGVVYYAIQLSSDPAPDAEAVIRMNSSSLINDKFDLSSNTTQTTNVSDGVYGGYEYTVYAVMTSVDGIASSVKTEVFQTSDTSDPVFSPDNSVPVHGFGYYDPTVTNIFLNFSEPVFYNAGDITLTGTRSGEVIIINSGFSQVQNVFIGFSPGILVEDELYVVSFDADTFRDNSGKPVAELAFGAYLWATDHYSTEFELSQLFGGLTSRDFDYTIIDNVGFAGLGLPIPLAGTYTVNLDGDKSEFFNAVDQTYGDDSYAFKVRYEAVTGNDLDGPDPFGYIYLEPNPQQSLFTSGGLDLFWNAWYDFDTSDLTGFYDTSDGKIDIDVDFGDYNGFNGSNYFGDLFYDYTPTVTKNAPIKIVKTDISVENMLSVKASAKSSINVDLINNIKSSPSVRELFSNKPYRSKSVINSLEIK